MENQSVHFRHILLYYFKKGKNATQSCKKLQNVYGEDAIKERQCQYWFARFRKQNFDLNDAPRSGRPAEVDDDKLKALIDADKHLTIRELSEKLQIAIGSVHIHLKKLGFVSKFDVWVPHDLKESQLAQRINLSNQLLLREENDPFLKKMVIGDEKWIVYNNVSRKRSWCQRDEPSKSQAKATIHQRKVMLSIWWDWKGVVYYELLPKNLTINSNVYCRQLQELKKAIDEKRLELVNRKGVVFHHDNARPHTCLKTSQKLLALGWDVLPHPAYSPDLAPSDYHLFRSLQNSLNGKNFENETAIKSHLDKFFAGKDRKFYERGIMQLPERWQKVIQQNGQYIID